MTPRTSSISIAAVSTLSERRRLLRGEAIHDFAGVAIGVALGALVWLAFLSIVRVLI